MQKVFGFLAAFAVVFIVVAAILIVIMDRSLRESQLIATQLPKPPVKQLDIDRNHPAVWTDADGFMWSNGNYYCQGCHEHRWNDDRAPAIRQRLSWIVYGRDGRMLDVLAESPIPFTKGNSTDYDKYFRSWETKRASTSDACK